MPRRPRGELRGEIHHILNRGNNRQTIFHDEKDFAVFIALIGRLRRECPTRIYAFCLMSNHFHAIVQSRDIDTMSRLMHKLMRGYTVHHHRRHNTSGRLWQDRYKAFPIERDEHFLVAVRYVLRNPVRAKLVQRPRDYPWSSLTHPSLVDSDWPVERPANFEQDVEDSLQPELIGTLRASINRQLPFGSPKWTAKTSEQIGIPRSATAPPAPPISVTGTLLDPQGTESTSD